MRPLEIDPAVYPWQGVAAHGYTPFSCMLISHIEGNLWVGGCIGGLRLSDGFKYVLSLYPWEKYTLGPDTTRIEFQLYDDELEDTEVYHMAADKGLEMIERGQTLIHCQAGLNRSGLIAALVLMRGGRTADEALALLREKRTPAVLCNPHFQEFLASL